MMKFLKTTTMLTSAFMMSVILAGCGDKAGKDIKAPIVKTEVNVSAGPALWLVKDADTNVYLFGTVHVLKPSMDWQTATFTQAFSNSDVIYQEADVSLAVQQKLSALIPVLGMYSDGGTLFDTLDDDDEKEVLEAAALLNFPPESLNQMRPWLASIVLSQVQMQKSGYSPDSGVEAIITSKATKAGKTIRYLETAEWQLHMLADLPEDSQVELLVTGAEAIEDTPDMLDDLVADWAEGDVAGIADLMSDEDVLGDHIVYTTMLVNRNRDWTVKIKNLMDEEAGTFFIAVGAAHLAGDDSVITMLRAEGERVVRQ